MDKPIYTMSVAELQTQLLQKDLEYKEAIKTRKVFWQVRKIIDQKRMIERELARKSVEAN